MLFSPQGFRMLLAIDCGNTNIVFSIFDSSTIIAKWRTSTNTDKTSDEAIYAPLVLTILSAVLTYGLADKIYV